jgi:hypothetical protein
VPASAGPVDPPPPDPFAEFRARVATGDYGNVLGRGLGRALREAARDPGLETEIGFVRLALLRLLSEESDPTRLASGVARLTGIALQAARLRPSPDPEWADFHAHMLRTLDEIEAEHAAEAAAGAAITTPDTDELG